MLHFTQTPVHIIRQWFKKDKVMNYLLVAAAIICSTLLAYLSVKFLFTT